MCRCHNARRNEIQSTLHSDEPKVDQEFPLDSGLARFENVPSCDVTMASGELRTPSAGCSSQLNAEISNLGWKRKPVLSYGCGCR